MCASVPIPCSTQRNSSPLLNITSIPVLELKNDHQDPKDDLFIISKLCSIKQKQIYLSIKSLIWCPTWWVSTFNSSQKPCITEKSPNLFSMMFLYVFVTGVFLPLSIYLHLSVPSLYFILTYLFASLITEFHRTVWKRNAISLTPNFNTLQ